jgi:hypothetical protein
MKKRLFWASALLSLLSIPIPAASAGKIAGYQYYTFPNGDYPLVSNTIHVIPCRPRNNDCKELVGTIKTEVKKALADLERAKLTVEQPSEAWSLFIQLDQRFLPMLSSKAGYQSVQTKAKGVYSFKCPTESCLVYSTAFANNRFSYWVVIHPSWKRLDLGPGREMAADKPLKI